MWDFYNLSALKEILLNLEAAIDSYDVPSDKGITKPGRYVGVWYHCILYCYCLLLLPQHLKWVSTKPSPMHLNTPSQVLHTLYSHILIYMNAMLPTLISYCIQRNITLHYVH